MVFYQDLNFLQGGARGARVIFLKIRKIIKILSFRLYSFFMNAIEKRKIEVYQLFEDYRNYFRKKFRLQYPWLEDEFDEFYNQVFVEKAENMAIDFNPERGFSTLKNYFFEIVTLQLKGYFNKKKHRIRKEKQVGETAWLFFADTEIKAEIELDEDLQNIFCWTLFHCSPRTAEFVTEYVFGESANVEEIALKFNVTRSCIYGTFQKFSEFAEALLRLLPPPEFFYKKFTKEMAGKEPIYLHHCSFCKKEYLGARHSYQCLDCKQSETKPAEEKKITAICSFCGKKFHPKNYVQRYCSEKCRRRKKPRKTKNLAALKVKTCAWCGKEFFQVNTERYCSKECVGANFRNRRKKK